MENLNALISAFVLTSLYSHYKYINITFISQLLGKLGNSFLDKKCSPLKH